MKCAVRVQTSQEKGEVLSLHRNIWEKFLLELQVCLYIVYIFTSLSAENREKFALVGSLFLPSYPVGLFPDS